VIADFRPDVVHVASPAVIGAVALRESRTAAVPAVAVFQTDLAGFARSYGLPALAPMADRWVATVHGLATSTLAPSSPSVAYLESLGVHDVRRWPRGVDGMRFHPDRRSEPLRTALGAPGRTIVGYAGRLAKEKELDRLIPIAEDPSVSLVIIGHGPCERELRAAMPAAAFLGFLSGDELAVAIASLDVFVHTGRHETFCQTVQEALCAGIPVVAPRAGGPIDLVEDGGNGLLWDPAAPGSLIDCVDRVVGDAAFRRRLAERARASVVDRTWESVLSDLVGTYEQVASVEHAR
jgi:phosphatidylinositol alpha 1,6-mannosyltransferase